MEIDLTTQILLESNPEEMEKHIVDYLKLKLFEKGIENPIFNMETIQQITDFIIVMKKSCDEDFSIQNINFDFAPSLSVTLQGDSIVFKEMKEFSRVCAYASNLDIYPLTTGDVKMSFMFQSVLK